MVIAQRRRALPHAYLREYCNDAVLSGRQCRLKTPVTYRRPWIYIEEDYPGKTCPYTQVTVRIATATMSRSESSSMLRAICPIGTVPRRPV